MTMKNSKLHMTLSSTLLIAVVFFSSGFTTIVKYCSMSQSSECCCESEHSDNKTPQTNEPSVTDQNSSCFTVKVIGGLNDINSTVTTESSVKMLAIDAISFDSEITPLSIPIHSLSLTYTDDVAPPNGDICIRISSLLI
jgi:hypothetical protein